MNRLVFPYCLTAEAIMTYGHSIAAPLQQVDGCLVAPPTMPITFWHTDEVPWLAKEKALIHGQQSFRYETPLKAGDQLACELALIKCETKAGRSGQLILYTHRLECWCRGELAVTADTVLISREGGTN
ncbi:FAS1-like dehydratase domain-containing protein [Paenibacillus sanguinis]|uniref:FAS1-like dehydratase domain-containing protein n=1 Tax=Paenibacillus sanguinis TaxID=225906 RepID=UPI000363EB14|nr:MaoC family dehydratase N-terminal domain-containing protein [Paenibacillus sanguinis]